MRVSAPPPQEPEDHAGEDEALELRLRRRLFGWRLTPKRALVGRPLAGSELGDTLLSKRLALPIFASDALSSVAYATESALVVLVGASLSSRSAVLPISIAVAVLLAVVALSYQQTVRAYTTSGGAYVVAKENLGVFAGLLAASALLIDYVLTVAVSVSAGILAVTSVAHGLAGSTVGLALGCVAVLTLVNLRGVRESGLAFALPTYLFIGSMLAMIVIGLARLALGDAPRAQVPHPVAVGTGTLSLFVLLRAFASGSSALTGVEAISNGVSAFRRPQAQNAVRTLGILAVLAISMFLGVSYLAVEMHAAPSTTVSVLAQIARGVFPTGSPGAFMYYVVQGATLSILVLAANTSFQGFPRLLALLAQDRFAPRQFRNLGDRLVFSNGMVVLALLAGLLIWAFGANVDSLIHLYVLAVFTAFTPSHPGMVRHCRHHRDPGWQRRAAINGFGAGLTGLVAAVVIATKFTEGAWAVIVAAPLLMTLFYGIRRHYRRIGRQLRAGVSAVLAAPPAHNNVLLYTERLDEATLKAAWYAHRISAGDYTPLAVPDARHPLDFEQGWNEFTGGLPQIETLERIERRSDSVIERVWGMPRGEGQFVTVVIPEQFTSSSLLSEARQGTELALKVRLLREPFVAIADVTLLRDPSGAPAVLPKRISCRILVPDAHAASLRALRYADTLTVPDTRAVYCAFDDDERARLDRDWRRYGIDTPLDVIDAPYRDVGYPLRKYLRKLTADEETVVVVVMPELRVHGTQHFLHNQTALYIKRLLLFERRVILTSVPYLLR
ncbi:MAG: hypothetical protein NVS2B6_07860 [Thermoleophilaceae bacterium]